jgi:multiple antibiotic resistance protein
MIATGLLSGGPAQLFLESFVTLFVIMDPPGTLPVFIALTARMEAKQRARAAAQAVLVSLIVIVAFAVFGQRILDYLSVSLPALQAAGGLLLLLVSLQLLTGQAGEEDAGGTGGNVAMVPLGTPLLAGPGAIVATMVFVSRAHGAGDHLAIGAGILAVHLILFLVMRFSAVLHRLLRESGVMLLTRIAGLLLSAIAVQLVADAIRAFIAGEG